MSKFEQIQQWYHTRTADGSRMWTEQMVHHAVARGWLTELECARILSKKKV